MTIIMMFVFGKSEPICNNKAHQYCQAQQYAAIEHKGCSPFGT